jgi:hypothetical protein
MRFPDRNDIVGGQKKGSMALGKNARLVEDELWGLKPLKNKGLSRKLPELQFSSS